MILSLLIGKFQPTKKITLIIVIGARNRSGDREFEEDFWLLLLHVTKLPTDKNRTLRQMTKSHQNMHQTSILSHDPSSYPLGTAHACFFWRDFYFFFLTTPTEAPPLPVDLVCWPLTLSPQKCLRPLWHLFSNENIHYLKKQNPITWFSSFFQDPLWAWYRGRWKQVEGWYHPWNLFVCSRTRLGYRFR